MDGKVPHIISSARVDIGPIGTAFIHELQLVYSHLVDGHTKEDAEAIRTKVQNKEPLSRWEQSVMTMTNLITVIHSKAQEQGFVEYLTPEQFVSTSL
jgi:hypothetical protein